MNKLIINATDVRNDFFNIVDTVAREKKPIYIRKDREVLVKLEPAEKDDAEKKWKETKKVLDATRGMWSHLTEEEISGRFNEADEAATKKIRARKW